MGTAQGCDKERHQRFIAQPRAHDDRLCCAIGMQRRVAMAVHQRKWPTGNRRLGFAVLHQQ